MCAVVLSRRSSLALFAGLWLSAGFSALPAATFNVSSLADSGPNTLRQAMLDANANGQTNTINLTVAGTITLQSVLPMITSNLTINGLGAASSTVARSGSASNFTVFLKTGGTVTISNLTVSNGAVTVANQTLGLQAVGGGIYNSGGGLLTLTGVTVTNCQAIAGASTSTGLNGGVAFGGGIASVAAPLAISNSTISNNVCTGGAGPSVGGTGGRAQGAGLYLQSAGTVTISNTTFTGNVATGGAGATTGDGGGGAIFVNTGSSVTTLVVSGGSAVTANTARAGSGASGPGGYARGGGIFGLQAVIQVSDSSITGNSALGGGTSATTTSYAGGALGGGIYLQNAGSSLTVTNSSVGQNTVTSGVARLTIAAKGGGIYAENVDTLAFTGASLNGNVVNGDTSTAAPGSGLGLALGGLGGGLYATGSSTLTMTGGQVSGNFVYGGDGNSFSDASGGGLYHEATTGTISGTQIKNNTAQIRVAPATGLGRCLGGGVCVAAGSLAIQGGSELSGNVAWRGGGAYNKTGATLLVAQSTVAGNTGRKVGGIHNRGTFYLQRSTLSGNAATDGGGPAGDGGDANANGAGAVFHESGTFYATNSTLSGNTVAGGSSSLNGGAILVSGPMTLTNNTITDNEVTSGGGAQGIAATNTQPKTLRNNIVAGNRNNTALPDVAASCGNCFGNYVSNGFNLIGNAASPGEFSGQGDMVGFVGYQILDPQLGPLADNGGPTKTHLPQAGSLALDRGGPATDPITGAAITVDQRGSTRPIDDPAVGNNPAGGGDGSDVGAVEVDVPVVLTVTSTADSGAGTLRAALATAAGDGRTNVIVFAIPAGDPGNVGGNCTITLSSPLAPGVDGGRLTTIEAAGPNRVTLSGGGSVQVMNIPVGANLAVNAVNFTQGFAGGGGAIDLAQGATLSLTNCAIFGNTAVLGGGIRTTVGSTLKLTNVTISGNTAFSVAQGGGLNAGGSVTALSCTITNNSAQNEGGVLATSSFTISNTIIAGNTATAVSPDANGSFTSLGYNLIGDTSGASGFTAAGDQAGTTAAPLNARLAPLANNGGPTLTHALQVGSPAIDTGSSLLSTDQRGLARLAGARPDKGAYELQPEPYAFWASYAFPPGLPAAATAYDADPDGDGIPNWLEQFTGRNPLVADTGAPVRASVQGGNLLLQFPRSITADPAKVFAEQSLDLQTWTTPNVTTVNLGPSGTNAELIQIQIPLNSAPKKFGRLHYVP